MPTISKRAFSHSLTFVGLLCHGGSPTPAAEGEVTLSMIHQQLITPPRYRRGPLHEGTLDVWGLGASAGRLRVFAPVFFLLSRCCQVALVTHMASAPPLLRQLMLTAAKLLELLTLGK